MRTQVSWRNECLVKEVRIVVRVGAIPVSLSFQGIEFSRYKFGINIFITERYIARDVLVCISGMYETLQHLKN